MWVDPSGKLVEHYPKPDGETRIVFAGDPTYPPDFDFTKRPNNRRWRSISQRIAGAELAQAEITTFTEFNSNTKPDEQSERASR